VDTLPPEAHVSDFGPSCQAALAPEVGAFPYQGFALR
jgi:hypothetical protein